jgi:hypothetical protein
MLDCRSFIDLNALARSFGLYRLLFTTYPLETQKTKQNNIDHRVGCIILLNQHAAFGGRAALGPGRVKTEKSGPTQEPLPSAAR